MLSTISGGSLDIWCDAECGCRHCCHSWIIGPPGDWGCDMEGVLSRISCLGYPYVVCCPHCNGWVSEQIWSHLLVQPICSQGLSFFFLTGISLCIPFLNHAKIGCWHWSAWNFTVLGWFITIRWVGFAYHLLRCVLDISVLILLFLLWVWFCVTRQD